MIIRLPRDTDVKAISGELAKQNEILKAYFSTAQSDVSFVSTWAEFKHLCQLGTIGKYFNVGDQLKCQKGGKDLLWDIVHIGASEDGSNYVILQTHYCLDSTMQFDPREAIFRTTDELPAGTYHFTTSTAGVTDTSWTSPEKSGWSKTWQFKTAKSIPKGGQVCFKTQKDWNSDISAFGIATYSGPDSTTIIESVDVAEGSAGTDLSTLGVINHAQRICYGYNRWAQSPLRQWLNSEAAASAWFEAQHDFQRIPDYGVKAGFMNDLDADFKAVITKSRIITDINKISDNGGHDTTYDYFFLPCIKNLNGGDNYYSSPGSAVQDIEDTDVWEYYLKFRQDGGTGANLDADANRLKGPASGGNWYWWQRSPYPAHAYSARSVDGTSGAVQWCSGAYAWYGVAPACRIN